MKILAEISTKDRYNSSLPLTLMALTSQTRLPDRLVIYDDGEQKDLRVDPLYMNIFGHMRQIGLQWEVRFGQRKGQHHNHQNCQKSFTEFDAIWRVDDDLVPANNCLELLEEYLEKYPEVNAVGPLILSPTNDLGEFKNRFHFGKIENILWAPNVQWYSKHELKALVVDHLHCSFLYRRNIADYDLRLSPVAHREETLFSFALGNCYVVTDAKSWHYKNSEGGIRSHKEPFFYEHDERLFLQEMDKKKVEFTNVKLVCLDMGVGDHFAFKQILEDVAKTCDKLIIAAAIPECFWDIDFYNVELLTIQEAQTMGIDTKEHNVYAHMGKTNFDKGNIVEAFKEMYL